LLPYVASNNLRPNGYVPKPHKQDVSSKPNDPVKPITYGPKPSNNTSNKTDLCNPNLLYDATLLFIADVRLSMKDAFVPMTPEVFKEAMPYCVKTYKTMFGLETEDFWKGTGPAPFGFTGSNSTAKIYRLYGLATPEYPNHFPITNGLVYDDVFLLQVTVSRALGGEWGMMMGEMGMTNVVDMGTILSCGQYRLFENDTTGMSQIAPNIMYFTPMPMMPMYSTTDMMDLYNSVVSIYLQLEQCWWGAGQSVGNSIMTLAADGTFTAENTNVLTFPPSILNRQSPPKYTECEPLPPS